MCDVMKIAKVGRSVCPLNWVEGWCGGLEYWTTKCTTKGEYFVRRPMFSIPITIREHFWYLIRRSFIVSRYQSKLYSIPITTFAEKSVFFGTKLSDLPKCCIVKQLWIMWTVLWEWQVLWVIIALQMNLYCVKKALYFEFMFFDCIININFIVFYHLHSHLDLGLPEAMPRLEFCSFV
jgi:hypothetical protein